MCWSLFCSPKTYKIGKASYFNVPTVEISQYSRLNAKLMPSIACFNRMVSFICFSSGDRQRNASIFKHQEGMISSKSRQSLQVSPFCTSQSESPIRKRPRTMASSQKRGCSLNIDNEGASCSGPIYNVQPPLARVECPGASLSPVDSDAEQQEFPFQPPQLHNQVKLHKYDVSMMHILAHVLMCII